MAGRLMGKGSASSSTVASPSAKRRTIERRVGSDKAPKTTSNRSGAATLIVAVLRADISQDGYLTRNATVVKRSLNGHVVRRRAAEPALVRSSHARSATSRHR